MDLFSHAEKTREGILKAVQAGKHIGRPPKWAVKDRHGNLKIREDMLPFIQEYLPYAESLTSKHDMEILMNHMLPKTVEVLSIGDLRRIRRSSFYFGYVALNGQYYDSKHSQTDAQNYWEIRLASQEISATRSDIEADKGETWKKWKKEQRKKARIKKFLDPLNKIQDPIAKGVKRTT